MLIPISDVIQVLAKHQIVITGVLHIGAHECEELGMYKQMGLEASDVVWVDAIPYKIEEARTRGIPNVYHAVITDRDDEDIVFNITNNVQSSSVLALGTHADHHPWVTYVDHLTQKSTTIQTFLMKNNLNGAHYNMWNLDIQGAELMALRGAGDTIKNVAAMYLEVNETELYKGGALLHELDDFLAPYGFKRVLTTITQYTWGDALYINLNKSNTSALDTTQ